MSRGECNREGSLRDVSRWGVALQGARDEGDLVSQGGDELRKVAVLPEEGVSLHRTRKFFFRTATETKDSGGVKSASSGSGVMRAGSRSAGTALLKAGLVCGDTQER